MKDRAEITVSGKALFPLNILSKRKIRLRRVRFEESSLKFTVSGRQLGACRDSLEEFNRKYEITKKKGAGFLFEALKKRVGAIVGLVFFIVAITVYSLCVFTVDISGNEIVDTDVIAERITSETKL
ncbi:MAG: sporulation protein YqfD, partial [Clostridia bacterium]|nr:sporulation protein YqfD [Clostridia bacterium]